MNFNFISVTHLRAFVFILVSIFILFCYCMFLTSLLKDSICLTGEKIPRKNLTQETCPDRGSNPGPRRDRRACYRLPQSGRLWLRYPRFLTLGLSLFDLMNENSLHFDAKKKKEVNYIFQLILPEFRRGFRGGAKGPGPPCHIIRQL